MSATRFWKLMRGLHQHGGVTYKKDDIIETEQDLGRLNQPPLSIKFVEIASDRLPVDLDRKGQAKNTSSQELEAEGVVATAEAYTEEELLALKVKELQTLAEDLELDLSEISNSPRYRKQELIAAILGT